ncbi:hypothetical protein AVEN_19464-1 [Araneus ventricosus]|uniref:Uncharacterized protein n=1 Tax=Araneus ventricosus TaxID=182803 RepID=A0A4Y2C7H6_ARAVE|nr:hypothetical protein AVEN_19464-1 [Araneus ventricosus]
MSADEQCESTDDETFQFINHNRDELEEQLKEVSDVKRTRRIGLNAIEEALKYISQHNQKKSSADVMLYLLLRNIAARKHRLQRNNLLSQTLKKNT